ncbi:MAG: hypothetical protein O3C21_02270 [Verrucomicrobia bacterium]|nr:hypothetical protein [Verrucomicrobiota bacterium]
MKLDDKHLFWIHPVVGFLLGAGGFAVLWGYHWQQVLGEMGQRSRATAQAKSLHLALHEYAFDNDGLLPVGTESSNEAFRKLMDRKFQDERIFFVKGSARHDSLPNGQAEPDNIIGDAPGFDRALEHGENHWAYLSGQNTGSKGDLPMIMDGFSGVKGIYAADPKSRGGRWSGRAIVLRSDGSCKLEPLGADWRVYDSVGGKRVDIFSSDYGTDPAQLLNPR